MTTRLAPGTRLILLAVPIVVLLGVIGLVLAWRNYQSERDQVIDESRLLAVSAAADANRFLRGEIALLEAVAASPTMRGPSQAAIEVYLQELVAAQPQMLEISWIDLGGFIRATAPATEAESSPSVSDQEYFRVVTRQETPYVSTAKSGNPADQAAVTVAVPTRDTGGALTGLIGARIRLNLLEEALNTFRPRGASSLSIVDRANRLIVSTDGPSDFRDLSASTLLHQSRVLDNGVKAGINGLEGSSERIVSFASAPTGGWMVFVERPANDAFSRARQTLIAEVVALTVVV
ncbi:MAG TPA: cache domain-containing protein, partial [Thermomicrobiales bacterium]|nr:cache domain-containing protein [Thermomicrobiales bacterium]